MVDVLRWMTEGFAKGHALIEAPNGSMLEIEVPERASCRARRRALLGIVPDLICVLDADTAEPITTEEIRCGQR